MDQALFQSLFQSVCDHARKATLLTTTADTLEWDERTRMPFHAGDYRVEQITLLRSQAHELKTDPSHRDDIVSLHEQIGDMDPTDDVTATVIDLHRELQQNQKLPIDLVERVAAARVRGQQVWDQARKADDYSMFRDTLAEMIDLQRESGQRMAEGTDRSPYDALLDTYEPDARADELQTVFDELRAPLVELISEISQCGYQPDLSIVKRDFDVEKQRKFSEQVAQAVGFSFDAGRLDETSHPFCTTLGPHDCRILTRYEKNWLPGSLYGTLHEAGHGMYEQGLRTDDWFGLAPGSYASLGVHESQSRIWENQVGRSKAFWHWLLPRAKETFAPIMDDVDLDQIYRAVNCIRPSLIRVEADEATYNLHILIRFDLERALIGGDLNVDDLPDAWNDRYEQDLGIRPPSNADGVLQDVHWSAGLFGYFPTYTLGNLISAQLYDTAREQLGDLDNHFQSGNFEILLHWLQQHIHQPGRTRSVNQLVQQATGAPLSPRHLTRYLREKLNPIYQL